MLKNVKSAFLIWPALLHPAYGGLLADWDGPALFANTTNFSIYFNMHDKECTIVLGYALVTGLGLTTKLDHTAY